MPETNMQDEFILDKIKFDESRDTFAKMAIFFLSCFAMPFHTDIGICG